MSGKNVGWALDQKTGSPPTKLVLVALAEHSDISGIAFPSASLIAKRTELVPSSVYKHLGILLSMGLIVRQLIERQGDWGRVRRVKAYRLLIPPERNYEKDTETKNPRRGSGSAHHGKTIPRGRTLYKNEPSTEPSLNDAELRCATAKWKGHGDLAIAAIGVDHFRAWLLPCELVPGSPYCLLAPRPFITKIVEERFGQKLRALWGQDMKILTKASPR